MAFGVHEFDERLPFCILEHTEGTGFTRGTHSSGVHWDWLFAVDHAGPLKTWSGHPLLSQSAIRGSHLVGKRTSVIALPDHRRRYLEYDGPLSRSRGHVRGLLRGVAQLYEQTEHRFHLVAFPSGERDGISIRLIRNDQGSVSASEPSGDTAASSWTLTVEAFKADASTPASDAT